MLFNLAVWRSTQEAEGTPLERVQVVNSGARVQIPPSPFFLNVFLKRQNLVLTLIKQSDRLSKLSQDSNKVP